MPRISEEDKKRGKEQVLMFVKRHHGLREVEIADMLNIHRRTINNYLNEMEPEGKVYKDGLYWHATENAGNWLRRFELAADEAFTLYLAARQFVKQTDKQNAMALSALSRLSQVLKTDLPVGSDILQAAQELRKRKKEASYEDIFATVVKAYLLRHPVQLSYRTGKDQIVETTFFTYLIEPSAIGYTLYLIGHSAHVNALRSYKIERIVTAVADYDQTYTIPNDFPGLDILQNAWSIMIGETTERVVLRFSPRVKQRVLETNWHPSQEHEPDPEKPGYLRWWVDVADTTDMKPWIRGWGADVEVMGPDHLRESIKGHARRFASMYDIATNTAVSRTDRLLQLWGKTSKDTLLFHPALYHMFDVAHIAQQLLSPKATSRWRQVLGHTLGCDGVLLYQWLPYLIALHDMGKLSPPFQTLNDKQQERLTAENFAFGRPIAKKQRHTIVGRLLLNEYTAKWPPNLRHAFLDMVSGHHGVYQPEGMQDQADFDYIQEPPEWAVLRQHAMQLLKSYLCQQWPEVLPDPANVSTAIAALNGFCILCDWLGSDGDYFTPKPNTPLSEYVIHSRQKAYERVRDAGLFQTAVSHASTNFSQLFHDFTAPPRPLQVAIEQIPEALLAQPTLTIIEAPTGEGKTEAALLLARRIAAQRGTDEMYIALPTTATSNAMYTRIITHIEQRLGLKTNVQLIHGQSFLLEDDVAVNSLINGENATEDEAAENWFAPKKKALLAPFGVGTVDQAELAALNVRHNALRLVGLAGKTIILDEVHAYDTYMTTIIKRMLNWLSALGSSVILLSAT
ncbi:MAG: CRISPR-associated endonuclease Cas3'', partial [Anaerolineales bacterium]|nr:CRISPR-associated endonuclease Cas3'' [Anaerolineales bacterium]